jgi:predicted Zn-dependent protease
VRTAACRVGLEPVRMRQTATVAARQVAARLVALVTALSVGLFAPAALAQSKRGGGIPLIRDAEVEQLLREYTTPILRVAGLAQQNVRVILINERAFNAFVMDGRRIFVNTGAIIDSETPNQMIGVLAHETGHIAGGHLSKMRQELANAQTASIIALLLGVGALVAGARSGSGAQAGVAAIMGPQEVIRRTMISYIRAQEEQADKAGVKFLNATGQSAKGMYETFRRFADQSMFSSRLVDPYSQTHPMPAERVRALEEIAKTSPHWDKKDAPELQARHDLVRAKLIGYLEQRDFIARRYPLSNASLAARYARAIAASRFGDLRGAIAQFDSLIQSQPNNPYFHEVKGQTLFESGHAKDAIAPLRRAVALAPNAMLIKVLLGQALIETANPALMDEAIGLLRTVLLKEPDLPDAYSHLAMAYGRKGNLAEADLASAQAAFASGDFKTARELANRAKTRFPTGSPGWVKADDVSTYRPPASAQR